jgi:PAS domain S-box-containing protein
MSKREFDKLRRKAEEQLAAKDIQIEKLDRTDLASLAHELAVHQAELEIQNEELLQSRREAEEARDCYLDLYDFAPVGYFTLDERSRIIEANLTGCRLLGADKRDIKNKPFARYIEDDEADSFYLYRKKVLEKDTKQTIGLTMKKVDGITFYAQLDAIKTETERLRVAVSDITERKKTEADISRLASFSELNPNPFLELDMDGNVMYANPKAKMLFPDLAQGTKHPFLLDLVSRIHEAKIQTFTRDINIGNSWYEQTLSYIPSSKTYLLYARDITIRKKAEDEVKQRTIELEAVNKELESFSYSVSHDLRAPLRSMAGFSTALLEDYSEKLDDKGKQYLKHIQDSSELMARLIDDLIKLSRVTRTDINYGKVNLSDMARKVVDELAKTEPTRKVRVIITPDVIAYGDHNLLRILFDNLMGNAWKFSSKTAEPRIEIGSMEIKSKLTYFVRDNGVGFDMAYAGKLFKPFQRLHMASEFPGTGIGLATVQRIVRRHGGKVWVESKVGEGATFFFTLE